MTYTKVTLIVMLMNGSAEASARPGIQMLSKHQPLRYRGSFVSACGRIGFPLGGGNDNLSIFMLQEKSITNLKPILHKRPPLPKIIELWYSCPYSRRHEFKRNGLSTTLQIVTFFKLVTLT